MPLPSSFTSWTELLRLPSAGAIAVSACCLFLAGGCSNTPYPGEEDDPAVTYYTSYEEPPKSLDPTVSYTSDDGEFVGLCYEGLFQYDYLRRPLALVPELAKALPEARTLVDAAGAVTGVLYRVDLQEDVRYIDDPCFPGGKGRVMEAADFLFAFQRAADPDTNCPVREPLSHVKGFRSFGDRARALRAEWVAAGRDPARGHLKAFFDTLGPLEGVRVVGRHALEIELDRPYPQILYWLALRFISAIPHEAVDTYHEGRPHDAGVGPQRFRDRPVATGAYRFDWSQSDRDSRFVLVRHEGWWGRAHPERKAPTTLFPSEPSAPEDVATGVWTPADAGRPLAQIGRIVFSLEIEQLSRFGKFSQGYYDRSRIPREMFTQVMDNSGGLTPEFLGKGVGLHRGVDADLRYVGFNMDDDAIGAPVKFHDPKLEARREERLRRNRAIRQALSLAVDATEFRRIFFSGLGMNAESVIPPAFAGYDPNYRNPHRQYDPNLTLARERLASVGCKDGIDPETGKPLSFTFDIGLTDTRYVVMCQFLADSWRRLGVDVRLDPTDYNKFQEKMYKGRFQIFEWGWSMDYPDAENFLFLLHGPNSGKYNEQSPNHARYENPAYDRLFNRMENLRDDESATWVEDGRTVTKSRVEIIREMVAILEDDCPWIPTVYREVPILAHAWVKNVKAHPLTFPFAKYYQVDTAQRARLRREWNRPILWPAAALAVVLVAGLIPAILTIRRERR